MYPDQTSYKTSTSVYSEHVRYLISTRTGKEIEVVHTKRLHTQWTLQERERENEQVWVHISASNMIKGEEKRKIDRGECRYMYLSLLIII